MALTGRVRPANIWPRHGRAVALALGLALAAFIPTGSAFAQTRKPRTPEVFSKKRSFRIPFNIDPVDRPNLKDLQLWYSEDQGYNWKPSTKTNPDRQFFDFSASHDGEFWFAVQTRDKKGQLSPTKDMPVEPNMKVIVDTIPPTLVVDQEARRGSLATVRWDVRDDHLDLKTLHLEYQVVGGRDWRQVPIHRRSLIGSESWDAGTAEPLKVRASIMDKAENVAEAEINVAEGIPTSAGLASNDAPDMAASPSISQISGSGILPSPLEAQAPRPSTPEPPNSLGDNPFDPNNSTPLPAPAAPSGVEPAHSTTSGSNISDVFTGPSSVAPPAAASPGGGETIVVGNPKFPLQYSVEDAGPEGPATLELWVTADGGKTWHRRGEDSDKVSPILVDLSGEGTYGLRTVARAASGLGDAPPGPGDLPHVWVEVDTTPPSVVLYPPIVGKAENAGKVAISWLAKDPHLGPKPVLISWRADQPGARWMPVTELMENSGKFIWNVPADVPPRFNLRVDVVDSVGNRNFADSTQQGPVVVDRTKPKSRIIGLDPSVRSGMGPNARPLR